MAQVTPMEGQATRWRVLLSTVIVMAGTLTSRVLGLVREGVIADRFGASPELGAFRAVFTIPDLLYFMIIGGALGSAFIPLFGRLLQNDTEERAWEFANTVLTLAFVVFIIMAGVIAIFARPLLAFTVARTYNPELLDLAVYMMRLLLIQPLLLGLGGLMMAILQTFERFALPTIAFNIYNLSIIAAAWFFIPRDPNHQEAVVILVWGVVGGAVLYFFVMAPSVVRAGLRFKPTLNWRMPEVRRMAKLLAPRVIGQGALQINIIVMSSMIVLIGAQAQAANGYAYLLLMLPHGIIAVSLGTVMFPRLARLFSAGQLDELRLSAMQTLRLVLWVAVPAAVILAVLHVPIIRWLFQRGEFDFEALELTGRALLFYTPGVIGLAGAEIVIRTFYAMEDTVTPVVIGVATIVLNGLLLWFFITQVQPDLGLAAFSYSLTNMLEFVVLFGLLARRLGGLRDGHWLRSGLALIISTIALFLMLIASVRLSIPYIPGVTLSSEYGQGADFFVLGAWLAVVGVLGFGLYAAVGALTGAPEVRELWTLVRSRRAR
jgi:putative peptidoglycan lipid II flippase